jgi:ABC-type nitrate/sulfonate/bicarbonate transport system ATPase subunit
MDEPLSTLDNALNMQLRKEILQLHGDLGFTLVYVTHSRDEAKDLGIRTITSSTGGSTQHLMLAVPPMHSVQRRYSSSSCQARAPSPYAQYEGQFCRMY